IHGAHLHPAVPQELGTRSTQAPATTGDQGKGITRIFAVVTYLVAVRAALTHFSDPTSRTLVTSYSVACARSRPAIYPKVSAGPILSPAEVYLPRIFDTMSLPAAYKPRIGCPLRFSTRALVSAAIPAKVPKEPGRTWTA